MTSYQKWAFSTKKWNQFGFYLQYHVIEQLKLDYQVLVFSDVLYTPDNFSQNFLQLTTFLSTNDFLLSLYTFFHDQNVPKMCWLNVLVSRIWLRYFSDFTCFVFVLMVNHLTIWKVNCILLYRILLNCFWLAPGLNLPVSK